MKRVARRLLFSSPYLISLSCASLRYLRHPTRLRLLLALYAAIDRPSAQIPPNILKSKMHPALGDHRDVEEARSCNVSSLSLSADAAFVNLSLGHMG